jgi:hypothetical protein
VPEQGELLTSAEARRCWSLFWKIVSKATDQQFETDLERTLIFQFGATGKSKMNQGSHVPHGSHPGGPPGQPNIPYGHQQVINSSSFLSYDSKISLGPTPSPIWPTPTTLRSTILSTKSTIWSSPLSLTTSTKLSNVSSIWSI